MTPSCGGRTRARAPALQGKEFQQTTWENSRKWLFSGRESARSFDCAGRFAGEASCCAQDDRLKNVLRGHARVRAHAPCFALGEREKVVKPLFLRDAHKCLIREQKPARGSAQNKTQIFHTRCRASRSGNARGNGPPARGERATMLSFARCILRRKPCHA